MKEDIPQSHEGSKVDRIARVATYEFAYTARNLHFETEDPACLGSVAYKRGASLPMLGYVLVVETEQGLRGEYAPYMGGTGPAIAEAQKLATRLIGQDPWAYQHVNSLLKQASRAGEGAGVGLWDIALWDLLGKAVDKPIYQVLGGQRTRLPTYVSTWRGDRSGGLDSPESFVDFAKHCHASHAVGFKVHSWPEANIDEEVSMIRALGQGVGGKLDLMLDPACVYRTLSEALRTGHACDEAGFVWIEDPLVDNGRSFSAHRRLREELRTEIVMGERVRGIEAKANMIAAEATDRVRGDPEMDLGITGMLKVAHLAESFAMQVEIANCSPAQRHCVSAITNAGHYEICNVGPDCPNATPPIYACGYDDQLESIEADGCVPVPARPGLGVTYDWDYIRSNITKEFEVSLKNIDNQRFTPQ